MAEKKYIDKVAFNYAIREAVKKYPNSFYNGLEVARQIAHDFPAADVRPVVQGHIEEDENTYLFCSECKCDITLTVYETPDNRLVLRPNFCPNCGADMREES